MWLPRLALLLPLVAAACAGAPGALSGLENAELLNRLPPQFGPLLAAGPAAGRPTTAARRYHVTGASAMVTLGRPSAGLVVPDGPDAADTRVLLEQMTSSVMTSAIGAAPFSPWRRENDLRVQNQDGPPLRCSVLRRMRGESVQAHFSCVTGLYGRYLTAVVTVNHDAANAQSAQNLAGSFAGVVARMLANGDGLLAAAPVTVPAQAKPALPPAPPLGEDDAVPDPGG